MHHIWYWIAIWGGAGLSPKAPGTVGSIAALPFAWLILLEFGGIGLLLATASIFGLGILASNEVIRRDDQKDPSKVVVDEVAGQWLSLAPLGFLDMISWPWLFLVGFLSFRFFDIWKPWPVSWADQRLDGGLGVMADDILAGLYAGVVVVAAAYGLAKV